MEKVLETPAPQTHWNLNLLYTSPKDPHIERDLRAMERACALFEKKYRSSNKYRTSIPALKTALHEYERLITKTASHKPILYFVYRKELDCTDSEAEARIRLFEGRLIKAGNRIQFFELSLGTLPESTKRKVLRDKRLAYYRRFLERIFETARHDLTEPEEKILALKSAPASSMWSSGLEAARNKLTVPWRGATIPLTQALEMIADTKQQRERAKLWSAVLDKLTTVSDFAESEMNALCTDKKINDELRSFVEPYDATVLGYENDPRSVRSLVETVTKHFDISHRFYALKKQMLGLDTLHYPDRVAPVGTNNIRYSFQDSLKIVETAFGELSPMYRAVVEGYAAHGQIDVYPAAGKSGGAFCSSTHGLPTYILLNHVDSFDSLTTLAHELGHGIHGELSATQPILYEGYSTAVAETASTFFEGVAFDFVTKTMSDAEKIIALHDRIESDVSTIFRQIAFFNFELELHRTIRKHGWLSGEKIAQMLKKHLEAQLGPDVQVTDRDGLSYIYVGHFRNPFYVYSYAYGLLISKALRARVKNNPTYIQKVHEFLSAGRSKKPEQIFADIGITIGPKLFTEGLRSIEHDLDTLERLLKTRTTTQKS